jgi:hypothetical protein
MANFKTASGYGFFQFIFGLPANMGAEFTLRDRIKERSHFIFFSVNLKFDATIQQISDRASDVEALCEKSH